MLELRQTPPKAPMVKFSSEKTDTNVETIAQSIFGPALLAVAIRQCIAQTVFSSCLIRLIEAP